MKKVKQIALLLVCIILVMGAAYQRDGRIFGKEQTTTTQDTIQAAEPMRTLDDGTRVINTSTLGKDITGYAGRVPLEIYLSQEGKIVQVKALKNTETPEFFHEAKALLTKWNGKTPEEALALKVDAVSGATFSSRAIIGNMKVGLAYAAKNAKEPSIWEKFDLSIKTIAGLIVVLMAAIIPLYYKSKKYRTIQQILNTIVLGFWSGSFLSYTLFLSYASNGINWYVSIIPIIMLITAFIYPLFGKKNYYCNYICPCGSLQELVGKTSKKKWKIKSMYIVMLNRFRKILWATVTVLMLCGIGFEWMDYEIFSAFIFTSASVVVLILAAIFILLSYFVPRPYCRFVCPTGTFIKMA